MSNHQREKGKRFERECAAALRGLGFKDARRSQQYAGGADSMDLADALPGAAFECKRRASAVDAWMAQAERDAGIDQLPIVLHRRDRGTLLATIRLEDLWHLYRLLSALQARALRVDAGEHVDAALRSITK